MYLLLKGASFSIVVLLLPGCELSRIFSTWDGALTFQWRRWKCIFMMYYCNCVSNFKHEPANKLRIATVIKMDLYPFLRGSLTAGAIGSWRFLRHSFFYCSLPFLHSIFLSLTYADKVLSFCFLVGCDELSSFSNQVQAGSCLAGGLKPPVEARSACDYYCILRTLLFVIGSTDLFPVGGCPQFQFIIRRPSHLKLRRYLRSFHTPKLQ